MHSHKYTRGYAIVSGGPVATTGAARIAARAALRVGAGLVSIACDATSLPVYAASLEAVMTKPVADEAAYQRLVADRHVTALLAGPGAGVGEATRIRVCSMLAAGKPAVVDADGLSVLAGALPMLRDAMTAPTVLTPHAGEFVRLFGALGDEEALRMQQAQAAAAQSGAVVVLKGAHTLVAAPDGRMAVNRHASPYLATAGAGDALAGIITGLLAQGMEAFAAACAGVWLHGDVGLRSGPGLVAEDIPEGIPAALHGLINAGQ